MPKQSVNQVTVKTGGKLYIAGEYSVLTPGQTALIQFIPIFMLAEIKKAQTTQLTSDMFDYSVDREPDVNYALIQEALNTFEAFCGEKLPALDLSITGKLERDGVKFGIGSSGSVVVLTLKALAAALQKDLSKDILFKLASYTLLKQGDNGSMGDLACIVYESLISYRSFDRAKIAELIDQITLTELLEKDWGYRISPVVPVLKAHFLVGWTKQAAISKDMVKMAKSRISRKYLSETEVAVQDALKALETGNKNLLKSSLQTVSDQLESLSPDIYVDKLKKLKEAEQGLDAIAKSSGAGGGDCGIAFAFDQASRDSLVDRWQQEGIELLYEV